MTSAERQYALKISAILSVRMLGLFLLFPVFSLYAQQYQATPIMIGIVLGIYGLTQAIFQIPFGYYSDKYGRKPLLVIGLLLFLLGSVVCALADNAIGLIIGRMLQGLGAISAVLMATLADGISKQNRIKANAFIGIQIGIAFIISLMIAPVIAHHLGLSGLFWFIALLAILALFLVGTLKIPSNNQPGLNFSIQHLNLVFNPKLITLYISIFLLHLLLSANFVILPLLLQTQLNLLESWQFYAPVLLSSFVLMLPFIVLAHKFKKTPQILLLSIFCLIIVQGFLSQFNTSYLSLLLLLTAFFTFFNIIEASLPSLVANIAPDDKKGLAMGVFSTSQFLGIFSGGLIGGALYGSYNTSSVFLFGVLITFFWFFLVFSRQKTL